MGLPLSPEDADSPECARGGGSGTDFTLTHDWQDVPEGVVLPPGLMIKMDLKTGRNRARLAPGDDICPQCGSAGKLANHDGALMCSRCAGPEDDPPVTGSPFLTCQTCNALFPATQRGLSPATVCPACRGRRREARRAEECHADDDADGPGHQAADPGPPSPV
jgi:hypothetical protein